MSLTLCLLSLKQKNPEAKYVIWPRIDQKSCFKCILAAGLIPLIVENIMVPSTDKANDKTTKKERRSKNEPSIIEEGKDDLTEISASLTSIDIAITSASRNNDNDSESSSFMMRTDCGEIERLLEAHHNLPKEEQVLCVLSTTSCFAPRQPDDIVTISTLCQKYQVGHIINNAYGLQCNYICKQINRACVKGRIDAGQSINESIYIYMFIFDKLRIFSCSIIPVYVLLVVQSTDKNFMVPVGGAIITCPDVNTIHHISSLYPGRASMTPVLDMFITLLSMGRQGYRQLLADRVVLYEKLKIGVKEIVSQYHEEIVSTPYNSISIAVTLKHLDQSAGTDTSMNTIPPSYLGSMLFQRQVSGCRVVTIAMENTISKPTNINNYHFQNWGSHISNNHGGSYFTVACAVGMTESDLNRFLTQLEKCFHKLYATKQV